MGVFLVNNKLIETSSGHKKELKGKHEVQKSKLSTIRYDEQTIKGKQVLTVMTRKAVDEYTEVMEERPVKS
jgi:hypothetical protein